MDVIDFIGEMAEEHGLQGLPTSDRELIGVIVIYALVAIGLVHRWRTWCRPDRVGRPRSNSIAGRAG